VPFAVYMLEIIGSRTQMININ